MVVERLVRPGNQRADDNLLALEAARREAARRVIKTWGAELLVEEGSSSGYSCLVKGAIQDGPTASTDGGILYEAVGGPYEAIKYYEAIKFVRFPLSLETSGNTAAACESHTQEWHLYPSTSLHGLCVVTRW